MKRYVHNPTTTLWRHTLPLWLLLLLCGACTEATDIVMPRAGSTTEASRQPSASMTVEAVEMAVEIEDRTRNVITGVPGTPPDNPKPLTAIRLCVIKKAPNGTLSGYYDTGYPIQQFEYGTSATSTGWWYAASTAPLKLSADDGYVYAGAPAGNDIAFSDGSKRVYMDQVEVKAEQEFWFNDDTEVPHRTGQTDYLYGKSLAAVNRAVPGARIEMRHALAQLSFKVMEKNGARLYEGKRVQMITLTSAGKFKKAEDDWLDLATGEVYIDGMEDTGKLEFKAAQNKSRAVASGITDRDLVPVQAFGMVIPVTGFDARIALTLDDGTKFRSVSFNVDWEKGKNYIYTLHLMERGIEIDPKPKVFEWQPTTTMVVKPEREPETVFVNQELLRDFKAISYTGSMSPFGQDGANEFYGTTVNISAGTMTGFYRIGVEKGQNQANVTYENAKDYCSALREDGHSNWRVPSIIELHGIYRKKAILESRDGAMPFVVGSGLRYWSRSKRDNVYDRRVIYEFSDGYFNYNRELDNDPGRMYVRCVRNYQPPPPPPLTLVINQSVLQSYKREVPTWQDFPPFDQDGTDQRYGTTANLSAGTMDGSYRIGVEKTQNPVRLTYIDAQAYCRNLREDGHSNWRVPSVIELYALWKNRAAISYLPTAGNLWSSTMQAGKPTERVLLAAGYNTWSSFDATYRTLVRCVRHY